MNPQTTSILILDDESSINEEIGEYLDSKELKVFSATAPSEAFRILKSTPVDLAIIDIRLPEMSGLEVLKIMQNSYPNILTIIITGHGDMDSAIQALRLGAVDFFPKPFKLADLYASIEKNLKQKQVKGRLKGNLFNYHLEKFFDDKSPISLVVNGEKMQEVIKKMNLVARSKDTTVLITGESGTGKELVARGIHFLSIRKDKPFLAVNCSTIPDELFESEFFGFKKGSFTGSVDDKPGWFEAADGGTLFLDEIGDMKPNLQAKLLRVMEDRRISRLGTTVMKEIDVRVIAATNHDLNKLIEQGKFRADLFHRINTFTIDLPPLRERPENIPRLLDHYVDYYCHKMDRSKPYIDAVLLKTLLSYDYPGNVRELMHMVERALILCEGDVLTFDHFDHLKLKLPKSRDGKNSPAVTTSLQTLEKTSIEMVLLQCHHNKSKAARQLNISRQALDRKISKLGIKLPA
ncbi:MAG TPA: sigma-54 dependent transcriptional regulator [Bacteroidales bacterium]|nr:sigma-54 dependent transcriptional regulator [Bacteroidales bacterium]